MSRAALHALRLVWNEPIYTRRLSTAVISNFPTSFSTSSVQSVEKVEDFLEPESNEYELASIVLPPLDIRTNPIPWPTLFASTETQSIGSEERTTARTKPCDILAKFALEGDLVGARAVLDELKAIHARIEHRFLYLDTALATLDSTEKGKLDFLLWLELYPNRPATSPTPGMKNTWNPVIDRLCLEHTLDFTFLSSFLRLAGRKGLLPVVLPKFIYHFTLLANPAESKKIIQQAIEIYQVSTTSSVSTSGKAQQQARIVASQINSWWKLYLRHLVLAGWHDDAITLYGTQGGWGQSIQLFMYDKGLLAWCSPPSILRSSSRQVHAQRFDITEARSDQVKAIYTQINSILQPQHTTTLSVTQLRDLLDNIEVYSKTDANAAADLHRRFRLAFLSPSSSSRSKLIIKSRQVLWWHAEIFSLQKRRMDQQAATLFAERFMWVGLPSHPILLELQRQTSNTLESAKADTCYPTMGIITSVLPSLLRLLPPTSLEPFQTEYLKNLPALPPSLHPDQFVHLAFLREITHKQGPEAGIKAIERIIDHNLNPGEGCWNTVLLSLVGRNMFGTAISLLDALEAENSSDDELGHQLGGRWKLSRRSYEGMIYVLEKIPDKEKQVEQIRARLRKHLTEVYGHWTKWPSDYKFLPSDLENGAITSMMEGEEVEVDVRENEVEEERQVGGEEQEPLRMTG